MPTHPTPTRPRRRLWPLLAAVALCGLLCLAPAPARAKVPEPLAPPKELPYGQRAELEGKRNELLMQWDGLVQAVRAHNDQCRGVVPSSPQGVRCQVDLKGIKERIGKHLQAVERYNIAVTAAMIRQEQAPAPAKPRP